MRDMSREEMLIDLHVAKGQARMLSMRNDVREEVRVVDEKTGGEKCSKLARFSLIPPEFEWALAEHYGKGAKKYDDRNWERGYKWSLSLDALERHLNQWRTGKDIDQETGTHHLIAVAWHACALFIFQLRGLGTDDVRGTDIRVKSSAKASEASSASQASSSVYLHQTHHQPGLEG